ncbi:MAG: DNA-3-methyladenine glycosylase [Bacteroidetes bacterium]|nr:DNA-3-methyladenine glycosylase [Bacteroidota bacterium]
MRNLSITGNRINSAFFQEDVLDVAPKLIGKYLCRAFDDGSIIKKRITEIEIYRGEEDLACHASKGKTARNEIMYKNGGVLYIYLIYGMHWMLNFVTGDANNPQAILLRGIDGIVGPGRTAKKLKIDKSFNGEDLGKSKRIWIEKNDLKAEYTTDVRIGIDYAGDYWKNKAWRLVLK